MTLIIVITQSILITNWANWLLLVTIFIFKKNKLTYSYIPAYYLLSLLDKSFTIIPGLQNILSIIHPTIILIFYGIILRYFFDKTLYNLSTILQWVCITLISLVLGGWWAFQEFTWGGWWNWDGVETPVLLLLTLVIFLVFHRNTKNVGRLINFQQYLFFFKLVVIVIILTRYGVLNSVHSFIQLDNVYQIYWGLMGYNVQTLNFLFFLKISSFWTFLFFKPLSLILLLIFLKYFHIYYTISCFHYKTTQHKLYLLSLIFSLVYNVSYVEFSYISRFNHTQLITLTDQLVLWKKPETYTFGSYFFHLNSLIN